MGTIFEDLVRRFNEDNNEEAGEHWTPRDAVELMAQLVFQTIRDRIKSGTYLLYDGAIGTGGMLTIAEQTLRGIAEENAKQASTHITRPQVYRVVREMLPRERLGPDELLRWLEETQECNERARRSHAKLRAALRASPHVPP